MNYKTALNCNSKKTMKKIDFYGHRKLNYKSGIVIQICAWYSGSPGKNELQNKALKVLSPRP